MKRAEDSLASQLFFAKEAADYLGITPQRLSKLAQEGKVIPLKKSPSGTIYHIDELKRRKRELAVFDSNEALSQGKTGMFSINTPTRHEAVNLAVVMNLLHLSEKKACAVLDDMSGAAFYPMTDSLNHWSDHLNIASEAILNEYRSVVSAFSRLRESDLILRKGDPAYPRLLAETQEAPRFLYLRGHADFLQVERTVALVGSRAASDEGKNNTKRVARVLGSNGIIIVSGLARGIDVSAHVAALENGFPTIAVIGTNLNQYYPSENMEVQKQMEKDGLIVSQFSPATKTERWFFPLRDGVMSGLSRATVIMEAGETSGALKQADYALKQNRLVLIPQNAFSIGSITWPAKFEKRGAIRVKSPSEILDVLSRHSLYRPRDNASYDLFSNYEDYLVVAESAERYRVDEKSKK